MKRKSLFLLIPFLLFSLTSCEEAFNIGDLDIGKDPVDPPEPPKSDPVITIYADDEEIPIAGDGYDAGEIYLSSAPTLSYSIEPENLSSSASYIDKNSENTSTTPPTTVGEYRYLVEVSGNDEYNPASKYLDFTLIEDSIIIKETPTITISVDGVDQSFSESDSQHYVGEYTLDSIPSFDFSINPDMLTADCETTFLNEDNLKINEILEEGTYKYCVYFAGNDNYEECYEFVQFDIIESAPVVYTYTINSWSSVSHSYSTGNYGHFSYSGKSFDYYRAVGGSELTLIHPTWDNGFDPEEGSIETIDAFYDISKISVTYSGTGGLLLSIGDDVRYKDNTYTFEGSFSLVTKSASFSVTSNDYDYFQLSTISSDVVITKIVVEYTNVPNSSNNNHISYDGGTRTVITPVSGSKISGVTTGQAIGPNGSLKTYTYYELYDIVNNYMTYLPYINSICLTDPIDVCNYFALFNTYPVNYVLNGNTSDIPSTVYSAISGYLREVQSFNRTDGYATNFPWNAYSGGKPNYYEFDIKLDSYSMSGGRGVGRIVCWRAGFSCYNDSYPVFMYTDDHYATFEEYRGDGTFAPRFDSNNNNNYQVYKTGYSYSHLNNQ